MGFNSYFINKAIEFSLPPPRPKIKWPMPSQDIWECLILPECSQEADSSKRQCDSVQLLSSQILHPLRYS
jgi:hypothetical protein